MVESRMPTNSTLPARAVSSWATRELLSTTAGSIAPISADCYHLLPVNCFRTEAAVFTHSHQHRTSLYCDSCRLPSGHLAGGGGGDYL